MIYCGIDWAERTHDVALVDDTGQLLAKSHITDDAAGYKLLLDLLVEYGDTEEAPIPVAIETSRGLLVAVLRAGRRKVFAINPLVAARYRDRHAVSRKKSDPGDALVLANILCTDMHAHRPLPDDTDLARAVAVLARAQQDATWNRQQMANQLRSLLREYYPAALAAFELWKNGLRRPEAREILKTVPTPARAVRLTRTQLASALRRAGRQRGIEAEAERLREIFRADWAHQPALVEDALGWQMLALLGQLTAACIAADDLAQAVEDVFPHHPDAEIICSFPGLGAQLGAGFSPRRRRPRALRRRPRPQGLRRASPVTRASGKKSSITRRWVKNDRLNRARTTGSTAPERPAQPRQLPLGLLRHRRLTRRESPLPAPPRRPRRLARLRPAEPLQPHARPALPLPQEPPTLRRATDFPRTTCGSHLRHSAPAIGAPLVDTRGRLDDLNGPRPPDLFQAFVVVADPVLLRAGPDHGDEAARIVDRDREPTVLVQVEPERQPAVTADAGVPPRSQGGKLLLPCVQVVRGEVDVQPGVDEAREHENIRTQDVVEHRVTGLEAPGDPHDAAVPVLVGEVNQVHRNRVGHLVVAHSRRPARPASSRVAG